MIKNTLTNRVLKPYSPKVFQSISDFPMARNQLENYKDAISSLGAIICKYRFEDVVGINLLHKHFDITNEEIIVRRYEGSKKAYMQPKIAKEVLSNCIPYLWAFSTEKDGSEGWYPIEFIEWKKSYCPDLSLLDHADGFLLELGEKLTNLGLQDVFGIAGLYSRQKFTLGIKETLLETTDESTKTLTLKIVPEDVVKTSDTTQTLWLFSQPILN